MRHLFTLLLLLPAFLISQELSVFELFTDHAVLQRDMAHPIWGWAKKNSRVTVSLAGESYRVRADREGRWTATLPATPAGGPHTVEISDGRKDLTLTDVYFGDVYLLSGQSNMEWRLARSDEDSTRARAIADPMIRQVLVAHTTAEQPIDHLELSEKWKRGTTDEIADFSGVGAYFAHYLRKGGVEVPIGLVHSSWGGSRIEPWLSAEVLGNGTSGEGQNGQTTKNRREEKVRAFYGTEFNGEKPPTEDRGEDLGYLRDELDQSNWGTTTLPGYWEAKGYENVDGIFYYRRTFELTDAQASGKSTLYLGAIDDGDWTYINGKQVGSTPDAHNKARIYDVPSGLLRAGKNTLAIRVYDGSGNGGFSAGPEAMYLETDHGKVPLAGEYRYRMGEFKITQANQNQIPTILYNAMIAPMRDWPMTGVLWYQGESNAGSGDAEAYADRMRTLVNFWRQRFSNESLPFYWVQLANFKAPPTGPDMPGWAILRSSQTAATDLPFTGQAVITDIGEADDIHPKNKWEVGRRLSLHALSDIYGREDVQAHSPIATSISVEGAAAIVEFSEVGEGLVVKSSDTERYDFVKSLAVEDRAGNWHWAVGILHPSENSVMVMNPAGTTIKTVRYAWFDNPDDANLFSKGGLPVTPFEISAD